MSWDGTESCCSKSIIHTGVVLAKFENVSWAMIYEIGPLFEGYILEYGLEHVNLSFNK